MKQVYLAEDIRLANRQCALAEMLDAFADPDMQRKAAMAFHREAEMLARLDNPHIPRVYDNFSEQNRHYLVMEYVQGTTLEEKLGLDGGGLSEDAVTEIGLQIAEALEYLHGLRPPIVYRDLKPSNLMVTADGLVKLIDFGIARYFQPLTTATAIGTQGYAAPEQYKGKAEVRSDIYALGATMHHLLTGRDPAIEPPFTFPPIQQLRPKCNPALANLINEALAYQPDERTASAAEFRQLLLSAKGGVPRPTGTAGRIEHSGIPWRQRVGLYALAFFGYTSINGLFHAFWHSADPLWLLVFKLAASFVFTLALVEALGFSWRRFRARQPGSGASVRFTWRHHAGLLALACLGYDMMVVVAFLLGRAKISLGNPVVTAFILTVVDTVAIVEGFIAFCGAGQRAGREAGAQLLTAAGPGATSPSNITRPVTSKSRAPQSRWILVGVFGLVYASVIATALFHLHSAHRSETAPPRSEPKESRSPAESTSAEAEISVPIPADFLEREAQSKPDDADAWLSAARAWYSQAKADEYFDLEIAPRHRDAIRILGYTDRHRKEYRHAARAYEHYFALGGDDQGARLNLAAADVEIDSASKAVPECNRVLAENPSSFRAELILGVAYTSTGNYSEARAALQKAAKLASDESSRAALADASAELDARIAALNARKARRMAASTPKVPAQQTVGSSQAHFTIGSTKDEVLTVQGTPTSVHNYEDTGTYGQEWDYGDNCNVRFPGTEDKVKSYDNSCGRLHVRLK